MMVDSRTAPAGEQPVRRIRLWQHGRAVRQMIRAYPPGVDALVDRLRSGGPLRRFALQRLLLPLYFAREEGWAVPGERGEMAAIMYLRRQQIQGIWVLHIDDINVDARYRRRGLAQRLLWLAEELARRERRPFLKLAVTVANTPAVTLYRRLGFQEQHHRYFTFDPSAAVMAPDAADDVRLRALRRRPAGQACQRFARMELRESAPEVGDMMAAYYLRAARGSGARRYAVEQGGEPVGYGEALRRGSEWRLRLSLRPDVWGTETERQAIRLLAAAVTGPGGRDDRTTFALDVPSAAHCDALRAGSPSLASELGLVERTYDRMIMARVVPSAP
jgi:GNAT superfamily N-acetyltransferase